MTEVEVREAGAAQPELRIRGFHFPGFDGLRAIAAISVAITHSAFISGFNIRSDTWGPYTARMDIGVSVFFVISGFLLYRPFVLARFTGVAAPAVGNYFRRRFLRIFPAFWLVFTAVLLLPWLHGLEFDIPSAGGLVAHYTLTHIYFEAHVLGPVQQSWTLATEIAYYVFLPVYAFTLRRTAPTVALRIRSTYSRFRHACSRLLHASSTLLRRRDRSGGSPRRPPGDLPAGDDVRSTLLTELAGVGLLYAFSAAFRIWLFYGRPARLNGMYNTWLPARLDLFALGMLLAVFSTWFTVRPAGEPGLLSHRAAPWLAWAVALVSFWFLSVGFGLDDMANRGPVPHFSKPQQMWLQFFWGATAFFLVAPAVFGPQDRGGVRRFLTNRVVAWVGLTSYGIYLWHEAVIDWYLNLTEPVAFASSFAWMTLFMAGVTAVFAAASYYLVERPVLRLKDRPLFRRRASGDA